MELHATHDPEAGLEDVGMVVVGVVRQVVGLDVEGRVGEGPLDFEVERGGGAEGLGLAGLGVVEGTGTVLEGEIPLGGEVWEDAVVERGDKFVAEEGHAGNVVES